MLIVFVLVFLSVSVNEKVPAQAVLLNWVTRMVPAVALYSVSWASQPLAHG
ncbi:MAG: hypothetical protein GW911_17695 [Armatimonadetes bacterium]|nr:hypothetical protein [Armatimonadota bacterium]NCP29260.1 hypothetical protein [Armatimonadota bacterium]NDK13864.1 hypothetical protein [Armatimonadota bacterium]